MSRALLYVLLAVVAWGAVPLLDKISVKSGLDPFTALTCRAMGILLTLLTVLTVTGRLSSLTQVPPRIALMLAVAGVISGVVGMWFYFSAMQLMDAALVVGLTSTYPALTMLLSWALLGEKLNGKQWLAVGLIISGVVLLEYASSPAKPDEAAQVS